MNRALRKIRVAPVLMLAALALATMVELAPVLADEAVQVTQTAPLYLAGSQLEISCTFTAPSGESLESLLWTPHLPSGYTLVPNSATGDGAPELDAQGSIIVWGYTLPNPLHFSYRVNVPVDAVGVHELGGNVEYQLSEMFNPVVIPIPLCTLSDASATHAMQGYLAGERMEVECTFSYAQGREMESLLWTPELPPGWTLVGATGAGDPQVNSIWGDITFFGDLTSNPVVFRYTVEIPASTKGPVEIGGLIEYALNGMANPLHIRALPDPLIVPEMHTLEIVSEYGEATPVVGIYTNFHGVALTNQNNGCFTLDSRTFACSGWTMTGNEPLVGFGTNCLMTLTNNAVLTWTWVAPLISPAGSASVTMDEDNDPLAWVQPEVSAITTSTPEGQPAGTLSWSLKTQAGHGSATVSGSGSTPTITYMPTPDYYGGDSFEVLVEDGLGGSDWITVNVTVQSVNDAPVLSSIGDQRTDEFTPLSFTVSATDVDLPPQSLTYTLDVESIGRGMVIDPVSGAFTWTPSAGMAGIDFATFPVTVTVTDNGSNPDHLSDSETFTITLDSSRATHSTIGYIPGALLAIDCQFIYPAGRDLESLLWRPELPDGWTLVSASGDGNPELATYDGALVLGSYALPNPVLFTYYVQVPLDATGTNSIGGLIEYKLDEMPNPGILRAQPDPLIIPMLLILPDLQVADKDYDGLTNATVVSYGSLAGVMLGHDVQLVTSNAWAFFDTPDVGSNKVVTVGGLALAGEHASWYAIDIHVVTAAVTRASLTITANDQVKIYGADMAFLGSEFTSVVLLSGETVTSVTLMSDGAVASAAAGTYDIVASAAMGTGLDNYTLTYVLGTLTITPGILGTVFDDQDRLSDNTVDGVATNAGGLFANLVDPATHLVIASVAVNINGAFGFYADDGVTANTDYEIILTVEEQIAESSLTAAVLALPWISTGEFVGTGSGDDGTSDSKVLVSTTTDGVRYVHFGIVQAPNLSLTLATSKAIMKGADSFFMLVQLTELNSISSDGKITVRVPKDSRWVLDGQYDPNLKKFNVTPLSNSEWSYSQNASQHIFTSTTVIPGNGIKYFGFNAIWDAGQANGSLSVTAQIDVGSGGDHIVAGNLDVETLTYIYE